MSVATVMAWSCRVAQGGGECGEDNMRTLCKPCHTIVTRDLMRELSAWRKTVRLAQRAQRDEEGVAAAKAAWMAGASLRSDDSDSDFERNPPRPQKRRGRRSAPGKAKATRRTIQRTETTTAVIEPKARPPAATAEAACVAAQEQVSAAADACVVDQAACAVAQTSAAAAAAAGAPAAKKHRTSWDGWRRNFDTSTDEESSDSSS